MHGRQAVTERSAWAGHVHAHSERAGRNVRQQERGMPVRWIVVRCGARFQYEDAQGWVRRRETARDDAASSATYKTYFLSKEEREGGRGLRTARDDDIVFFVDGGGCRHRTFAFANLIRWRTGIRSQGRYMSSREPAGITVSGRVRVKHEN